MASSVCRGSSKSPSNPQWQLAWCSERCFKAEQADQLRELAEIAENAGGALVSFRKAKRYQQWLSQRKESATPYVLATDWREAKPCLAGIMAMEEFVQDIASVLPLMLVVICNKSEAHYSRACNWASSLRTQKSLSVVAVSADRVKQTVLGALSPTSSTGARVTTVMGEEARLRIEAPKKPTGFQKASSESTRSGGSSRDGSLSPLASDAGSRVSFGQFFAPPTASQGRKNSNPLLSGGPHWSAMEEPAEAPRQCGWSQGTGAPMVAPSAPAASRAPAPGMQAYSTVRYGVAPTSREFVQQQPLQLKFPASQFGWTLTKAVENLLATKVQAQPYGLPSALILEQILKEAMPDHYED
eukprot:TRINITY_DN12484_c0_g1_i4.p2 TRINITY_DN12484_c0_g1~~TRINITY_DN12484_c0_g1_i4.p2  ORF type:complete len:356 (-),score=72.01 TRINITY_DN12484_c0_g1_i4:68-1135(-)